MRLFFCYCIKTFKILEGTFYILLILLALLLLWFTEQYQFLCFLELPLFNIADEALESVFIPIDPVKEAEDPNEEMVPSINLSEFKLYYL